MWLTGFHSFSSSGLDLFWILGSRLNAPKQVAAAAPKGAARPKDQATKEHQRPKSTKAKVYAPKQVTAAAPKGAARPKDQQRPKGAHQRPKIDYLCEENKPHIGIFNLIRAQ